MITPFWRRAVKAGCSQAIPSQSAEDGDLREAQIEVPLLGIPALDRIAGLCNRYLNSDWEYANANRLKSG
jgi:hypothetical protein